MDAINAGDTAWVLISSALVLMMTPALAFFYGGMVRKKNILSTLNLSFHHHGARSASSGCCIGYSLAFGADHGRPDRRAEFPRAVRGWRRAQPRLRADHPAPGLCRLPDDVRHHHPGADHRGVRGARALQDIPDLQPAVGHAGLRPGGALGVGRRRHPAPAWARSTSPAARWCTSRPAFRRWPLPW